MSRLNQSSTALLAVVLLSTAPAFSQSAASEGPGMTRCAELVEAKTGDQDRYREYAIWISGFLTAANAYEADTFDLTPWQPIEMSIAQITQFCEANKTASVSQAVASYVSFLRPNRLKKEEKLTSLRNGQQAVFVYPSVLAQLRAKLIEQGFLDADTPQEFGKDLGEALQQYQRAKGLEPSGLPDVRTLIALLG